MQLEDIERAQKLITKLTDNILAQSEIIASTTELLNNYVDYLQAEIKRLQNA